MIEMKFRDYLLPCRIRAVGGGGTEILSAVDAILALDPLFAVGGEINFFLRSCLAARSAVPNLACLRKTLRGGLTMLSTYANFVVLTGVELSIDCLMLAFNAFNFVSLSSKQR